MAINAIRIPRASDEAVIAAFRLLSTHHGLASVTGACAGDVNLEAWDLNPNSAPPRWKHLLDQKSDILQVVHGRLGGLTIGFIRGGEQQPKDPYLDEIRLTYNEGAGRLDEIVRMDVAAILSDQLGWIRAGYDQRPDTQTRQLEAVHASVLHRLETVATSVIEKNAEYAIELERKLLEGRQANQAALDAERSKLTEEHEKRSEALEAKEVGLKKRLEEVDNRDNTHARREIRNRMLEDVRARINNFGVSTETAKKRLPVRRGIFALLILLVSAWVFSAFELYRIETERASMSSPLVMDILPVTPSSIAGKPTADASRSGSESTTTDMTETYLLWIRMVLVSLGVAGTLLYYIRWENRWAERHADNEFQLQQFYLDVNRANWAIESCLEWRKETDNSPIPSELLASITRNLFIDSQGEPEQVVHPADELASALLGSSSKLTLRAGGNELEFDKPGKIPRTTKT